MQPTRLPKKKDVALALLEQTIVRVHLDPRTDKVLVPSWFKRQPELRLDIGLNMPIPIPDLEIDDAGLSCTLSFNRTPHHCQIPWNAVFALIGHNGRGMVWPDDVPPEVDNEAAKQAKAAQAKARLAAVPAEAPAPARKAPEAEPAVAKPARRKKVAAGGAKAGANAAKREPKEAKTRAPRKRKAEVARPAPAAARTVAAPEAARTATAGDAGSAGKRKRELPPYLRVVK